MKILIISDSHGLNDELFYLLDKYKNEVDFIIHCGDSELLKSSFSSYENLLIVGGNCDYDISYIHEICHEARANFRILITHGHLYNINFAATKLSYRAEELGAKLVCFGHTHIPEAFLVNNVLYINPGSICQPRRKKEKSYVVVEFEDDKFDTVMVTFFDHQGNEILDLRKNFCLL
jgi:uncharacterized protein